MLKDLDQRQVEQQGSSNFTVPVTSPSSNKKTVFISLVVIILLNVGGIFVWQMYVENQKLKMSEPIEINRVANNIEQTIPVVSEKSQSTLENNNLNARPNDVDNKSNSNSDLIESDQLQAEHNKSIPERTLPIEAILENTANETEITAALANKLMNSSNTKQYIEEPVVAPIKTSTLKISRKKLSPHELAKQKLLRAEQALANNDISQAETLFEDVLLVMPEHRSARKQLAALWFGRQAYSDALNLLSRGINLSPNYSEFRVMKARVHLQQNQVQQAFETLNYMSNVKDVVNVEYQSIRATTAQQLNEYSFAAEAYQALVNIEPSAARWWLGLAVAFDSNGEFEQASNAYQTALNKSGLSGSAEKFARQRIIELGE
jgi:MSHA biogenesis protein MshN